MDIHRKPNRDDTRTGRDCQFCRNSDPDFGKRDPMDRLVTSKVNDTAGAHMTENGYVKHRALEIGIRLAVVSGLLQRVAA